MRLLLLLAGLVGLIGAQLEQDNQEGQQSYYYYEPEETQQPTTTEAPVDQRDLPPVPVLKEMIAKEEVTAEFLNKYVEDGTISLVCPCNVNYKDGQHVDIDHKFVGNETQAETCDIICGEIKSNDEGKTRRKRQIGWGYGGYGANFGYGGFFGGYPVGYGNLGFNLMGAWGGLGGAHYGCAAMGCGGFGGCNFGCGRTWMPAPMPVPVEVPVVRHVNVPRPVAVPVPQPVEVPVARPYDVPVPRAVPVPVARPVNVANPVPVPVVNRVDVPVYRQVNVPKHIPVPLPVVRPVHVPVPKAYPVAQPVPVASPVAVPVQRRLIVKKRLLYRPAVARVSGVALVPVRGVAMNRGIAGMGGINTLGGSTFGTSWGSRGLVGSGGFYPGAGGSILPTGNTLYGGRSPLSNIPVPTPGRTSFNPAGRYGPMN